MSPNWPAAAGLLLVAALRLGGHLDGLAIRHPRRVQVDLDAEAALDALADDLDVHLAHAGDDHLAGLLVALDRHHGVFFGEATKRADDLVFVALALGGDGLRHEGRRELEGRERGGDALALCAESIAGEHVLQLGDRPDVAGHQGVDGLLLLAHGLEELADALLVAVSGVDEVAVALDGALEDAEQVDAAAELVGERLEHEGGGRPVGV